MVGHRRAGIGDGQAEVIAVRLAVASGGPALHGGHPSRERRLALTGGHIGGHGGSADLDLDLDGGHRAGRVPLELDVRVQHPVGAVEGGQRPHRSQPDVAPGLDGDRAPHARAGQVGAPVPAIAASHLADGVEGVRVHVGPGAQLLGQPLGGGDRCLEPHHQLVAARDQQGAHVEAVRAVLVGGAGQLGAVQGEDSDGVETLGDEVVVRLVTGLPVEHRGVGPAGPSDPGQGRLVVPVEGVGDQLRGQQVGVHLTRDGGRDLTDPHLLGSGGRCVHRPQGPGDALSGGEVTMTGGAATSSGLGHGRNAS